LKILFSDECIFKSDLLILGTLVIGHELILILVEKNRSPNRKSMFGLALLEVKS